jgi:hypothetical protein
VGGALQQAGLYVVRGVRRGSLRQSRLFLGRRSSYGLGRLGRCLRRLRLCRLRPRNRLLGRRFKATSIRWLNANEI